MTADSGVDPNIVRLRNTMRSLEAELSLIRTELYKAEMAALPIRVGMIVRSGGKEYRIADIRLRLGWHCWVIGNPRRKDGSWGTFRRNLYDQYEIVRL